MSDYMCVLILSGLLPLIVSFFPPLEIYRNPRALLYSISLIVIIFGSWDSVATARGHWYFNPSHVWSLRVINLPVEEVLFFIIIPFCCIFTWEAIRYIRKSVR